MTRLRIEVIGCGYAGCLIVEQSVLLGELAPESRECPRQERGL